MRALLGVLWALFALVSARLFVLQVVESDEMRARALAQRVEVVRFPARRGAIYDRDGRALAISVDTRMVVADPTLIDDKRRAARRLGRVLDLPPSEVHRALRRPASPRFTWVARQVEPAVARRVEKLGLPGVYTREDPRRVYPGGELAAHLLGFVNVDGSVKEGLEAQYDALLEGRPGRMLVESDPHGRPLPQGEYSYRRPQPGASLVLTLDRDIQYFTERFLAEALRSFRARAGTAIVMRPRTGEILALANVPTFDPNSYSRSTAEQRRNRALTDVYEPGSAFKVVTLAAALAERVVSPDSTFVVPDALQVADRVIHDSHSHETETMTVTRIIAESSNVGTVKIGQALGARRLDEYVRRFGFGRRTGLDFPGESPGIVVPPEQWSGSSIANIPIGQGVAVTPLQMLMAYNTVANGGRWVEPKLLRATVRDGEVVASPPPAVRRVVPRRVARDVVRILREVVTSGTGVEAQVPGYDVAGKTGTAQKVENGTYGDDHVASFAGFAPAHDPQVSAIVVLDEPTPIWGGSTAAPTFARIVQRALRELAVAPTTDAEKALAEIRSDEDSGLSSHD